MSQSDPDRYKAQKQLGAGAMGEVWLAVDALLNRPVAIKYLRSTENFIHKELFLSEARMLASLNHPHITLIYDAVFDEDQKRFYLVMEYVEGQSLADMFVAQGKSPPLDLALDISIGILQALEYAHMRGIVHRDIKPENVIMSPDGVKLTDFGLANLISLLSEGQNYMVGTPDYISPEQILGAPTDSRSDLYSLGVMLFEMFSGGKLPFEGRSKLSELLDAHLKEAPPSLAAYAPELPLALSHTVAQLLEKEPDRRPASAEAVLKVFRSLQARQKFSQPNLDLFESESKALLGRDDEFKRMAALWSACRKSAQPQLLLVQGELGIGKHRLISSFLLREIVDRGYAVITGRCDEAATPYAPFAEILAAIFTKGLLASPPTEKIDRLLERIPNLAHLLNIQSPKTLSPPQGARYLQSEQWQFFAAILTIFSELGPAVIYLQDAEHLDEASLTLIKFLIRQGQLPLLFIGAQSKSKKGSFWLNSLGDDERSVITLPPLSRQAVRESISRLLGGDVSEEIVNLLNRRGKGNPLYIEESIRQLLDAEELYQDNKAVWRYAPAKDLGGSLDTILPRSVMSAFSRQLRKLSPQDRENLAVAALIESGPEFDFDIWVALLEGEGAREKARSLCDIAIKKRFLRKLNANRYTFHPPDVAGELLKAFSKSKQRQLHQRIAEILLDQKLDPILIAYHYEQVGLASEAARYLEEAGRRAISANAVQTAINYYRRSVSLLASASGYEALGNLYRRNSEHKEAVEAYKKALKLAEQTGDGPAQAQILNGLTFTLWLADRYREAYQYAETALKLPDAPANERAITQSHLGMIMWFRGYFIEAEKWCQAALRTLQKNGDEAHLASAYNRLSLIQFGRGKLEQAEAAGRHSLALRQKTGDYLGQGYCLTNLGSVAAERGDFEQGLSLFYEALQLFEKISNQDGLMLVYANYGRTILLQNKPNKALPWLRRALKLALKINKRRAYTLGDIYLLVAQASLKQGNLSRAQAAAADALKLVEATGNRQLTAMAQSLTAQIYAQKGAQNKAEAMFKQALALLEQVGYRAGLIRSKLAYAQFLLQKDPSSAAAARLREEAQREAAIIGLYLG